MVTRSMRACDVIETLDKIALFRAQANQTTRRVDDLGSHLDSALALLDFRRSRDLQASGTTQSDAIKLMQTIARLIYGRFSVIRGPNHIR